MKEPVNEPLTFKQWILISLTIYGVMVGAFLASEFFKNVDVILYPSVFFLIAFSLIGPGTIIAALPPSFIVKHPTAAIILRYGMYPFCLLSLRLIYSVLHGMHIL